MLNNFIVCEWNVTQNGFGFFCFSIKLLGDNERGKGNSLAELANKNVTCLGSFYGVVCHDDVTGKSSLGKYRLFGLHWCNGSFSFLMYCCRDTTVLLMLVVLGTEAGACVTEGTAVRHTSKYCCFDGRVHLGRGGTGTASWRQTFEWYCSSDSSHASEYSLWM